MRELPQRCRPSSFCLGDFRWWRWSEWQWSLGWQWGKGRFDTGSYGKKEEREEWAREEEKRMRREEEEEVRKIEGEEGGGAG
jgi:hypothetical protein